MKILDRKSLIAVLSCITFALAFSASSVTHARGNDGYGYAAYDRGKNEDHYRGKDRNYRYASYHERSDRRGYRGRDNDRRDRNRGLDRGKHSGQYKDNGWRNKLREWLNPWVAFFKKVFDDILSRYNDDDDDGQDSGDDTGGDNTGGDDTGGGDSGGDDTGGDDTGTDPGDEEPTDTGVTITINDRALNPGTTFTVTYEPQTTLQGVLTDLLGTPTDGYFFQVCMEFFDPMGGVVSNCDADEVPSPLDASLTLEAAGIVEDPVLYLMN